MTAFAKLWSNPMRRSEVLTAYLFLLPTLLGFVIFIVGPVIVSIGLSAYNWNLMCPLLWPFFPGGRVNLTVDSVMKNEGVAP